MLANSLMMTLAGQVAGATETDWRVNNLRLSGFPIPPQSRQLYWEQLTGNAPASRLTKPNGETREEGPFADGKLVLLTQPLRFDILYVSSEPATKPGIPSLGQYQAPFDVFVETTQRWTELFPKVSRLALGSHLFRPTATQEEADAALAALLPLFKLDLSGVADFMLQINRPRMSETIPGLKLNRLSKWLSYTVQELLLNPSAGVVPAGHTIAVAVELDFSTASERREALPAEQLGDVIGELSRLALEVAARGDRP